MPLLWLSAAFMAGIAVAAWLSLPWTLWAAFGLAALGLAWLEVRFSAGWQLERRWRRVCALPFSLVLAALFFGALRFQFAQPLLTPSQLAWYNDRGSLRLQGLVVGMPDERATLTYLRVKIKNQTPPDALVPVDMSGLVLVTTSAQRDWRYGDFIELRGSPKTPQNFGTFNYADYLAHQQIYTVMAYPRIRLLERDAGSWLLSHIYDLRLLAYRTLNAMFPQPEASLMNGILLGLENDIPDSVNQAFRDTGTAHIVAISGFNIAILAGLFFQLASRVVRRMWAPLVATAAIVFYTILVGAQASVVRAAIMGAVGVFGAQIGRRQSGVNSLTFTGALMALMTPDVIWDVGFQLSFTATLGLVLFADPLQSGFIRLAERWIPSALARRISGPVGEYFLFTLAAQLTTLPVTAYHFGRISLSAVLANPLILPPQPAVMILGGVALLAGLVYLPLGRLLAMLIWPLPAYTIRVAEWMAHMPNGVFEFNDFNLAAVIVSYTVLLWFALKWRSLLSRPRESLLKGAAALIGLAAVLVWRVVFSLPDGRLHLIYFTSGEEPVILLKTPTGQSILINSWEDPAELTNRLDRLLPTQDRRLDYWVINPASGKSLASAETLLERYAPQGVLWSQRISELKNGSRLLLQAYNGGLESQPLTAGQQLLLEGGARVRVLRANEGDSALLLESGDFTALYPGGFSAGALLPALSDHPDAILLSAADLQNGWSPDTCALFHPQVVAAPLVIAGNANWINVPENGHVEWVVQGDRLWVKTSE